jgi:hypothetical protein
MKDATLGQTVYWLEWVNPRKDQIAPWADPEDNWWRIRTGKVLSVHAGLASVTTVDRLFANSDRVMPLSKLWDAADKIVSAVQRVSPQEGGAE